MSEHDELTDLYRQLYEDGFFVKEWQGAAAVGDLRDLDFIAQEAGKSRSEVIEVLSLGEAVDLCWPGSGDSRVERVRDGWEKAKQGRERGQLPRLVATREAAGLPVSEPHRLGTF